jgi:hypothetical protein
LANASTGNVATNLKNLHNVKDLIARLGHGDPVAFRNIRIKELP